MIPQSRLIVLRATPGRVRRARAEGYEEYHPYGSTAWWSNDGDTEVSKKRYRYTGMERDEETGLQCHGVRYYAVWLGTWTSADPIGLGDGVNRYAYCHGGPVGGRDETGMADALPQDLIDQGWTVLSDADAASVASMLHPSSDGPAVSEGVADRLREVRDHKATKGSFSVNTDRLDSDKLKTKANGTDWSAEVEAGRLFVELGDGRVMASRVIQGDTVTVGQVGPTLQAHGVNEPAPPPLFVSDASTNFGSLATNQVQQFLASAGVKGVLEVHTHPLSSHSEKAPALPSDRDIVEWVAAVPQTDFSWTNQGSFSGMILTATPLKSSTSLTMLPMGSPGVSVSQDADLGKNAGGLAKWLKAAVPDAQLFTGQLPGKTATDAGDGLKTKRVLP